MPDVLTVGESMALLLTPEHTLFRHAPQLDLRVGGAESNTAIGLARLGLRVRWVSRLGQDGPGELILARLRAEGVEPCVTRHPQPTGLLLREFTCNGPQTYYYRAGSAASTMNPADFPWEELQGARWLHLSGITPALSPGCAALTLELLAQARRHGIPVSFDVNYRAKLWNACEARRFFERCLPDISVLFVGDDEGARLWGQPAGDLPAVLRERTGARIVIKQGRAGSELHDPDGRCSRAPAHPVAVRETTGAGDAFNAGFLAAQLAGHDPLTCLRWGNALGAWCVTGVGDYENLPTLTDLEQFLSGDVLPGR